MTELTVDTIVEGLIEDVANLDPEVTYLCVDPMDLLRVLEEYQETVGYNAYLLARRERDGGRFERETKDLRETVAQLLAALGRVR